MLESSSSSSFAATTSSSSSLFNGGCKASSQAHYRHPLYRSVHSYYFMPDVVIFSMYFPVSVSCITKTTLPTSSSFSHINITTIKCDLTHFMHHQCESYCFCLPAGGDKDTDDEGKGCLHTGKRPENEHRLCLTLISEAHSFSHLILPIIYSLYCLYTVHLFRKNVFSTHAKISFQFSYTRRT